MPAFRAMPAESRPIPHWPAAEGARERRRGLLFWVVYLTIWAALLLVALAVSAQPSHGLRAQYDRLSTQLASSPFQRPLLLHSSDDGAHPSGEMHAVLGHSFDTLAQSLRRADAWCELLTLPANVKRCRVTGDGAAPTLQLAIGRKTDQPVEEAHAVDFRFQVVAAQAQYLLVEMQAAKGPLGTSQYRLTLEAVPLDARRSFVRMRYAYANNLAARLATSAYLATAGRDKVGFSVVGRHPGGEPRYVGGIQGIAERNTMRYFLAIESYLDTLPTPPEQRLERRLRDWFLATERYPRQLHELTLEEYLASKLKDAGVTVASAGR